MAINWQQVVTLLETATQLAGAIDPNIAATTAELASLEGVATEVVGLIAAQKGTDIATVVAGLTPETPIG